MKVLIIGGGGREHALIHKITQSKKVNKIYCAQGNAGIAETAECVSIKPTEIDKLAEFAIKNKIELTIVGPEEPLACGIVDTFQQKGLKIFGPNKKAAAIEYSKTFAKKIMANNNIPTPLCQTFTNINQAKNYLKTQTTPIIVKADGLAAGKGVIICQNQTEAINAIELIIIQKRFGNTNKVLIEEHIQGEEVSFIAFTDGKTILPLPYSQDHKKAYNNDKGPNTGGMGAYSPAPIINETIHKKIINKIIIPMLSGIAEHGINYKGFLYAGLIINKNKVSVLEFNCRLGDPEAQVILVRIENDIIDIIQAVIEEKLHQCALQIDKRASACVIMASKGYPEKYQTGLPITGIDNAEKIDKVYIFHSGTAKKNNQIITNGGRVLGVTALGGNIYQAASKAYQAISKISYQGAYYRSDIGQKGTTKTELTV